MIKENFIKIFEESFKENWELPVLSTYGESEILKYGDLAKEIEKLHIIFERSGIKKGDKIALTGRNTPPWCTVFLASITYGAVIVPILQDFNPNDVTHIINHSESSLLFISDHIWEHLEVDKIQELRGAFSLTGFQLLHQKQGETFNDILKEVDAELNKKYPDGFTKDTLNYPDIPNSNVVEINYTSGTTGFSKGVMITGDNLAGNIRYAEHRKLVKPGQKFLSILPLAHAYGCAFEFLYSLATGCHTTLLGKTPSPKVLLKAFEEVKPNIIVTVPLVIEKIYRKTILPQLEKKSIRWALKIPILNNLIYSRIRKKLIDAFGGNFSQVVIGGASFNGEVESFLYKIKFPFTVGYGMTECAPLISFDQYYDFIPTSCGRILDNMEVRIDSPDPYGIAGEIQVRGKNVMAGYFKNEEATKNAFTEDGWLKTGDLGTINKENQIFIRGRSKSMILSSNGQNIYPEEIEAKLNNLPFVMESLVVERNGKLVALIYPDYETIDSAGINSQNLPLIMEENKKTLNTMVAPYETIAEIQLYPTEFEKTPKKSIKRFLYQ